MSASKDNVPALLLYHLMAPRGAVRVKVFNDKKKFNKRKKRMENGEFSSTNGVGVRGRSMIGEWRMENFRQRMAWGLKCEELKENGKALVFSILQSPTCYSKIILYNYLISHREDC